jgi:hypothetical protein
VGWKLWWEEAEAWPYQSVVVRVHPNFKPLRLLDVPLAAAEKKEIRCHGSKDTNELRWEERIW